MTSHPPRVGDSARLDLSGADAKVRHARRLLAQGHAFVDEWLQSGGVELQRYEDDQYAYVGWNVVLNALPPQEAGLFYADALVNARAALDFVAWRVYLQNNPSDDRATVYFPILKEGTTWQAEQRGVKGATDEQRRLFMAAQDDEENGLLRMLVELSNSQKHTVLAVMSTGYTLRQSFLPEELPDDLYLETGNWLSPRRLTTLGQIHPIAVFELRSSADDMVVERSVAPPNWGKLTVDGVPLAISDGINVMELDGLDAIIERVAAIVESFR